MKKLALVIVLGTLLLGGQLAAQQFRIFYHPDDWVGYTNSRYVNDISRGFNTIYFATSGGILRYHIIEDRWLDPITVCDGMPAGNVRRLTVDRLTDEVWIKTALTSAYWNPTFEQWYENEPFPGEQQQPVRPAPESFPHLFPDHDYNYLPGGGLVGMDLLDYQITVTLADEAEVVWVGAWGLGPGKVDLRRLSLELLPTGPFDRDVAAVTVVGDDLWLLGGGGGLPGAISRWRRDYDEWEYFHPHYERHIVSDQYYALESDEQNVWIGTELGLVRYEIKRGQFTSYTQSQGIFGERVQAILPIRNNVIIGTERGVSVFDLKRDSIYAAVDDLIINREVYALAIHARTIFAATDFGIFTLALGGSEWNYFRLDGSILREQVWDLQVDGDLLYAVARDGLYIVDLASGDYDFHDRNTVFGNSDLQVVLVHEGVPWVGGANGLFRLNKETNYWYQYTIADGLLSDRVRDLVGEGEFVWIATDEGLTRFYWDDRSRDDWRR